MRVYLCDFVHEGSGVGSNTFPLNIGYIAAWAKRLNPKHEFELFKYPSNFFKAFRELKPDVVGMSCYLWNMDLDRQVTKWIRAQDPQIKICWGGPNIPAPPERDAPLNIIMIPGQGEAHFHDFLEGFPTPINQGRIKEPDKIPSPYLTGLLDKFFATNLIPIIETTRGCPYQCSYCGQTSGGKVERFSLERVKQELFYIAEHVQNTDLLLVADANFGTKRDCELAQFITALSHNYLYPTRVSVNWNKNPRYCNEISRHLPGATMILSLQSTNAKTLRAIGRRNSSKQFEVAIARAKTDGIISGTELILSLPHETLQSHLDAIRYCFDLGVEWIIGYNLIMLPNSALDYQRHMGQFECTTKFRLIDNCWGRYDIGSFKGTYSRNLRINGKILMQDTSFHSFEVEEGVRSTATLTEEDTLSVRPIHWLVQFLWNYRFYKPLLDFIQSKGINPLDYILQLLKGLGGAHDKVWAVFEDFKNSALNEWHDTPEDARKYYEERFQWLAEFGKLNAKFIFRMFGYCKGEFEQYLLNIAHEMVHKTGANCSMIDNIMMNCSDNILDPFNLPDDLAPAHKQRLEKLTTQYAHANKQVTLRKMSEYMDIRDFFRRPV